MSTQPHDLTAFQPLMPSDTGRVQETLWGRASDLLLAGTRLEAALHPITRAEIARLVTAVSCHHSMRLDGIRMVPADLHRVMSGDVVDQSARQRAQILAAAWMNAAHETTSTPITVASLPPLILAAHGKLYQHVAPSLRRTREGGPFSPGALREVGVTVAKYTPPLPSAVPDFITRFADVYGALVASAGQGGLNRLRAVIGAAAAHQRFLWIWPFGDGNGRVARLLLDSMLAQIGANAFGLWSMSRGLHENETEYLAKIADAHSPRVGNYDGRGTLSEKKLIEFCDFTLQAAIAQCQFMTSHLTADNLRNRMRRFCAIMRPDIRPVAALLYGHAFEVGQFERSEAARITSLPERTARSLVAQLVKEGFLVADSARGPVRIGFPVRALGTLIPDLYPARDLGIVLGSEPDPLPGSVESAVTTLNKASRRAAVQGQPGAA
jgi:Fic family protein